MKIIAITILFFVGLSGSLQTLKADTFPTFEAHIVGWGCFFETSLKNDRQSIAVYSDSVKVLASIGTYVACEGRNKSGEFVSEKVITDWQAHAKKSCQGYGLYSYWRGIFYHDGRFKFICAYHPAYLDNYLPLNDNGDPFEIPGAKEIYFAPGEGVVDTYSLPDQKPMNQLDSDKTRDF